MELAGGAAWADDSNVQSGESVALQKAGVCSEAEEGDSRRPENQRVASSVQRMDRLCALDTTGLTCPQKVLLDSEAEINLPTHSSTSPLPGIAR